MKYTLFILLIITLGAEMKSNNEKIITKNEMVFQWEFKGDKIHCIVTAPTTGWVAVGFNTNNQLAGTNLIMGSYTKTQSIVSDRYIIRPGNHQSIQQLGGINHLSNHQVVEKSGKTILSFSLPITTSDKYHTDINENETYTILLAYSTSDDFEHHSRMRTNVKLKL